MILVPRREIILPRRARRRRQLGFFTPMSFSKPAFVVDAADFDGTTDFGYPAAGPLSGVSDSKSGIFSVWARIDGSGTYILHASTSLGGFDLRVGLYRTSSGEFQWLIQASNGADQVAFRTSSAFAAGPTWRHILLSYDVNAGASHLYINDVSDKVQTALVNTTLDYTLGDWGLGAAPNGLAKWNGALAEMYFAPGEYLDFSVEANRRKFISSSGRPVYLGKDGSKPTGAQPAIYFSLQKGAPANSFLTNKGYGGTTGLAGTSNGLDTADSSPSD